MRILCDKVIDQVNGDLPHINRRLVQQVGFSDAAMFGLFFGKPIFRSKRLVSKLSVALRAFPPESQNLDSFLDFYDIILECRAERMKKSKQAVDATNSIFCSAITSPTPIGGDRSGRANITYTDVEAARKQCKHTAASRSNKRPKKSTDQGR